MRGTQFKVRRGSTVALAAALIGMALISPAAWGASAKPIVAAADPSLLPYNFYMGTSKAFHGINVDVAAALSKKLGRTIQFKATPFDSIIPGLKAGRYDIALTGMFDTKAREKIIDFVDYLEAKNNFLLRTDYSASVKSFDDLCGKSVGLPKGALEISLVEDQSKTCAKDGKSEVTLKVYPNLSAAVLALFSKRVDIVPNDSATNAYIIRTHTTKSKATGSYLAEGYFALGVPKKSPLLKPLQQAMQSLISSGEMKKILTRWGIADRMPARATVNKAAF